MGARESLGTRLSHAEELEEIDHALRECGLKNANYAIILVCVLWSVAL